MLLLGVVVVGLAVLGDMLLRAPAAKVVVRIDVPGFSGEITKDNGGVDIEVGKDR